MNTNGGSIGNNVPPRNPQATHWNNQSSPQVPYPIHHSQYPMHQQRLVQQQMPYQAPMGHTSSYQPLQRSMYGINQQNIPGQPMHSPGFYQQQIGYYPPMMQYPAYQGVPPSTGNYYNANQVNTPIQYAHTNHVSSGVANTNNYGKQGSSHRSGNWVRDILNNKHSGNASNNINSAQKLKNSQANGQVNKTANASTPTTTYYCEPCDKEFPIKSQYDVHVSTHEPCSEPGCKFVGSKKVVNAHYHLMHGLYSGTGYKKINVEGTEFNVLLGTSEAEVQQWREERKKRFPSANAIKKKQEDEALLKQKGGVSSQTDTNNGNKGIDKKNTVIDSHNTGKAHRKRPCTYYIQGKCKNTAETCQFSHDFIPKPCITFAKRGYCKNGNKCRFAHIRNSNKNSHEADSVVDTEPDVVDGIVQGLVNDVIAKTDGVESILENIIRNVIKNADNTMQKDVPALTSNGNINKRKLGENSNAMNQKMKKKQKKNELDIPKPLDGYDGRGTLLKNLLSSEVTEEANIILQCFRYFVDNNFFEQE